MAEILAFLSAHMVFLWKEGRYRITGSEVTNINGGDAVLTVESAALRMRFVRDRGQLFMDLQPTSAGQSGTWFSIDLVRRLHTGQAEQSAELDEGYAAFLNENLEAMEVEFSEPAWSETRSKLEMLKKRRSKEMFG